jgi:hypothetical protein
MAGRIWTDEEKRIMKETFADNYTEDVCKKLNRSYRSVCSQASLMKLKKSDSFMKMELEKQAQRLRTSGIAHRFYKGSIPANKGKPMAKEVYDKCKATMFKRGQAPHNENYDGHERLSKDGYVEIRIRRGKYVLKHRHIWEQENGPIPKEMILVFKDNNPAHIFLENLELITKAENMKRNTIHRYPAELKRTIRLVKKLNRKINEKQNN